jgi:8-oxo-dGTP diphosphatase
MATKEQSGDVLVGVGVIILRDGKVLLGERAGAHGAGTWALPGGHLEFGETVADCARREVLEETGLALHDIASAPYTSDVFAVEGRHYVTLFVTAQATGEPMVLEPAKCLGWQWFHWEQLPKPLFAPLQTLRDSGFVPTSEI